MELKSLLVAAVVAATAGQASAFSWEPISLFPMSSLDVTSSYSVQNVSFLCYAEGVAMTDVMPAWIDEDGNEIKAVSGMQDDWNPNQFFYTFDFSAFKSNGEYILLFPEGMLINGVGEKSDKVQTPYSFDVPELAPAMFDDFKILSITPDFEKPQAVWNDQVVTVNTNHNNAIGYVSLQITDTTAGESVTIASNYTTGRQVGDNSAISFEVVGNFRFFEGHDYRADFTFYNGSDAWNEMGEPTRIVDRASFTFTGVVEGYKYSAIELLGVSPEEYSTVISDPADAVFTYTFSGPVNVYKAATPLGQNGLQTYPESCLSSNSDKTVWTLDLSGDEYVNSIDAMLTIYVYARDLDGNQLKGNWGEETESCFVAEWECELGAKPIVVVSPAAGESISRLDKIVVKSVSGEPMAWSWMGEATVVNELGEIIATLHYDENDGEALLDEVTFTQWIDEATWMMCPIDLAKEGEYAIKFGPGCFNFGEQFDDAKSHSLTSAFIITGTGTSVGSVAAEAAGDVFDINGRLLLRGASAGDLKSLPKGVYVIGGKKVIR